MDKELLKKLNGYKLVSLYDGDVTKKNRKNSKKAKKLECFIIENKIPYKKVVEVLSNKEEKISFAVEVNETINNFLNEFGTVEIKEIPNDIKFEHPYTRSQKNDYDSRGEIYVDCLDMPEEINGWKFRTKNSYIKGNKVALISDDHISIGTYIPAGAKLFEKKINSIKEALEILKAK